MDKDDRSVYVELANAIGSTLCVFCRYPEWENAGCCEGYAMCYHPLERVCEEHNEMYPGDDCWGFRPSHSLDVCADIVGAILSVEYKEWGIRVYSRAAVTVYGRDIVGNESKVRIGHSGHSNQSLEHDARARGDEKDDVEPA